MIGARLSDRYELLRELGRGGMGIVYLAHDPLLERDVAVKLIPPTLLTPEMQERLRREAQVVARMDHPAIVTVYDFGEYEGAIFFVMPVVSGSSLTEFLREGSLVLGEVVDIGIQVASALDYSHSLGVVHRDIKPDNLMISRRAGEGVRVRIMDFGLARFTRESQLTRLTQEGTLVGTVSYFSPEQIEGRTVDERTDIRAIGAILYECLSGSPIFTGEVQSVLYRIVHENVTSLTDLGVEIDPELEQILLHCLARDAARRPQRAGDVAAALEAYRATLSDADLHRRVCEERKTSGLPSGPRREAPPFVGRDREIGELQMRLNAAIEGECQLVVAGGEVGIGKSRLLEELVKLARARKIRVLQGRFVERDRSFPYQGFCEVIQEYFRDADLLDTEPRAIDFSSLAADLIHLFPVLAEVHALQQRASVSTFSPNDAERGLEDQTAVFELLARTIARIAGDRPLVLVLEELHDAEISIEALQYIVRRLGPTPLMIAGSYRSNEVDRSHALVRMINGFHGDRHFASFTLGPLTPAEHRTLIERITGKPKLSDQLAEAFYTATEGNPFFTRELVRSLVDSGGIVVDESGNLALASERGLSSDALPETIQQVVERQIARLSERTREILSMAAVIGPTFDYRDLEVLAEGKGDVEEAIEQLLEEGLLEERARRGDQLGFASRVVRDALYSELSRRRRRSLHRRFAECLEARHAGRLERVYAELMHHYSQGDVAEKAVEYGFLAAVNALDAFSAEDAIHSARTALEFLEDEEWQGDPALEGEGRLLLAGGYRIQGDVDHALREVERAIKIFERAEQQAHAVRALLMAAEMSWEGRKVEETRRWLDRGIGAARSGGDEWALKRLLTLAATVANLRGDYEAAKEYLDEIERLEPDRAQPARNVASGGHLVTTLVSPVHAAEPAAVQSAEEEEVLANVFERLIENDDEGNLIPALCERWSSDSETRRFVFALRRGVRFSDGEPLTAVIVKASFERAIRRNYEALPAVFAPIHGVVDYLAALDGGEEGDRTVSGIVARDEGTLEIQLDEPLPLFPVMLTDVGASIVRAVGAGNNGDGVVGTGPFRIASHTEERIVLERNDLYWGGAKAKLDRLEFRRCESPAEIAAAFRAGHLDIAHGLLPGDLDQLLQDSRLRTGLAYASRNNSCFILFNSESPSVANRDVRRAMGSVVRTRDLVWRVLGRLAIPATGIIPPGLLGHDPGRRQFQLDKDRAIDLLRGAGVDGGLQLKIAVSPHFRERYSLLLARLFEVWEEIGIHVENGTPSLDDYIRALEEPGEIDLAICRWTGDYNDPDSFTDGIFQSRSGFLRHYYASKKLDQLAEQARSERKTQTRTALYRKYEAKLIDSGVVIPLFHEADYRLANASVRNLRMKSSAPFVIYSEVGKKVEEREPAVFESGGGVLQLAWSGDSVRTLDPALISSSGESEVIPNVFETLLRVLDGARVVPWLASDFEVRNGGLLYRFKLRDGVRFHDGRQLTARDARFTFERLLQNEQSDDRMLLASIRGASDLIAGRVGDLEGFRILSETEFTIELDEPLPFFPMLLTTPAMAIVPEGNDRFDGSWRDQCVGTGPFRVIDFQPMRRLELERNPNYWRDGYPKSDGLAFTFGLPQSQVLTAFRAGRLSLVGDLTNSDIEMLRHDPEFASRYHETPRLSTAFIAFNCHRGPMADVQTRRRIVGAIDVETLTRRALGRFTSVADGLIPPGLLGYDPAPTVRSVGSAPDRFDPEIECTAVMNTSYVRRYGPLRDELLEEFQKIGVRVRIVNADMREFEAARREGATDMIWAVWMVDYPDTNSLVASVLHSVEGVYGKICGSPEIDRLIEEGRRAMDPAARHAIYRQLEGVIARDALALPLFHPHNYRFARPEVEGVVCASLTYPTVLYENLWLR